MRKTEQAEQLENPTFGIVFVNVAHARHFILSGTSDHAQCGQFLGDIFWAGVEGEGYPGITLRVRISLRTADQPGDVRSVAHKREDDKKTYCMIHANDGTRFCETKEDLSGYQLVTSTSGVFGIT